jgi:hypothetical protein
VKELITGEPGAFVTATVVVWVANWPAGSVIETVTVKFPIPAGVQAKEARSWEVHPEGSPV